jgi:hypothetical protein
MTTRDDIQKALEGVTDPVLDARPFMPNTVTAWNAWPVWMSSTFAGRCVEIRLWQVLVILPPGDTEAWTTAAEDAIWPIREALETVGSVTLVEPIQVFVGDAATGTPALRFTISTPGT